MKSRDSMNYQNMAEKKKPGSTKTEFEDVTSVSDFLLLVSCFTHRVSSVKRKFIHFGVLKRLNDHLADKFESVCGTFSWIRFELFVSCYSNFGE